MTTPVSADVTGVVVARIRPRTAAAAAGLTRGDRVLAINGHRLRDAIDFQFHAGEPELELRVERDGTLLTLPLERRDADLGVELEPPRAGEIATCANKCVFCFIHQLPKGMRRSLYVKDDDFRLSFLHGNYITLTDLDEAAFERIIEQHLSPLYVSVHATDPQLRHTLLGRPRVSGEILPRLERLAKAGIRMHAQIVLCPGWNDGPQLERTVFDLAPLHPKVATTAIVPVGLTRHRERLPALRSLTADEAQALIATVEGWQHRWLAELGSRFVFPVTLVTGEMFGPRLRVLLAGTGLDRHGVRVAAVPNDFFGHAIGVAGLLTGQDVRRHLATQPELGRAVLVPAVAVRDVDGVFLDDLTAADLARDLGVGVRVVEPSPTALLRALGRV